MVRKLSTQDMHDLATSRGYRFLDADYVSVKHLHSWQCKYGHHFQARPYNIKTGHGCPYCWDEKRRFSVKRTSLSKLHNAIRTKGWLLISVHDEYEINQRTKMHIRCAHGHDLHLRVPAVLTIDCPQCSAIASKRDTAAKNLAIATLYAQRRGGEVLTTIAEYLAAGRGGASIRWRCADGHEWRSSSQKLIASNRWCPFCKHGEPVSIEDLHAHAHSRGGRCLSTEFRKGKDVYEWQCARGHTWGTSWFHIRFSNTWCPCCNNSIREQICRLVFEKVFGGAFPSRKPVWLGGLELDGFNEAMCLAFEHHGQQHYEVDNYFIKTEDGLKRRQDADAAKLALCRARGITLVEISNLDLYGNHRRIISDILHACAQAGVPLPAMIPAIDISPAFGDLLFQKLSNLVKQNGGSILSYSGTTKKARFRCRCGHEWQAQPKNLAKLKYPGLCRRCIWTINREMLEADNPQHYNTAASVGEFVKTQFGGECLLFRHGQQRSTFRCCHGHEFAAFLGNVQKGRWCPTCGLKKRGVTRKANQMASVASI